MSETDLDTAVHQIVRATRKRTAHDSSGFPFFLIVGAGISHPSIPLAAGIERLCREEIAKAALGPPPLESGSPLDRYERCFEHAFPHAEDRQIFLHSLIHKAAVSPANFRLAHLLGERNEHRRLHLTNLVFTTNFDEMLTRALRLFGHDVVVCDHPKTTQRIKLGRANPLQVVHVHGTHWFYDCRNLRGELELQAKGDLTDNVSMAQLLDRVLAERTPIVTGYSGWEGDVIMTALRRRLREPTLPHNLYWFCFQRSDANALPVWLREHASVRLVLPPAEESGNFGSTPMPVRSLPARLVFETLIRELELPPPKLTSEPLDFFAEQLRATLSLDEEEAARDLYLLRDVLRRVEEGARLEHAQRQGTTATEKTTARILAQVSSAIRRLAYKEALAETQELDLGSLSSAEKETLDEALDALYLGTADTDSSLGLAACELRLKLAETALREKDSDQTAWKSRAKRARQDRVFVSEPI